MSLIRNLSAWYLDKAQESRELSGVIVWNAYFCSRYVTLRISCWRWNVMPKKKVLEVNIIVPCNKIKLFPLHGQELLPICHVNNVWNGTHDILFRSLCPFLLKINSDMLFECSFLLKWHLLRALVKSIQLLSISFPSFTDNSKNYEKYGILYAQSNTLSNSLMQHVNITLMDFRLHYIVWTIITFSIKIHVMVAFFVKNISYSGKRVPTIW
jgi:hypothetical protein